MLNTEMIYDNTDGSDVMSASAPNEKINERASLCVWRCLSLVVKHGITKRLPFIKNDISLFKITENSIK